MDIHVLVAVVIVLHITTCAANVVVGVAIRSYSNTNGTSYVEGSSNRKCCDGIQRFNCDDGDTCDTYFEICVGRMAARWGCKGAFFRTKPLNNTNTISTLPMMESQSDFWDPGMAVFIIVRDDDSHGMPVIKKYDHIDTLIDEIKFHPSPSQASSKEHVFQWQGKTRLSITIAAWCDSNYYGEHCDTFCKGIRPMAVCDSAGQLSCQHSDAVLLEFRSQITDKQLPDIDYNVNKFVHDKVCHGVPHTVSYPRLHKESNTFTFVADCGTHQLTPIEFESILKLQTTSVLDGYFSSEVVTGPDVISHAHGEHIIPNVYISVELKAVGNPTGTSYEGMKTTGERRCCDVPRAGSCEAATDQCDLQVYVCIGEMLHNICIGAVAISHTYKNSNTISTCGSTLLDLTNNIATVSHPIIGAFRLAQNSTVVNVMVKDSDLNGNSSDIIDFLNQTITVTPGPNVTFAKSMDVQMRNIASVTLRLIFWCAPWHSGPLCLADNGTDTCQPGWYGDTCEIPLSACSPNPCKHGGHCNLQPNNGYNCTCNPGYTGSSCEKDVDECALHICQHNATCQNTNGAFNCICTSLWTGLICTEDRDPACDPDPCVHGKCIPDITRDENYRCECNKGWTNTNCNMKLQCSDLCIHGDCHRLNGIDTCICHTGFSGKHCNEDINECLAKTCQNGGECKNYIGSFTCTCVEGYGGIFCQNATGACKGVVCQHNGSCLDIGGAFLCMCINDFTGDYCETKINYCENITCANNGTCYEYIPRDFLCDCSQFWAGKTCDVDVNECAKDVCNNGGLCRNIQGSFNCDCPNGWTGSDCSSDVDECTGLVQRCKYGNCTNTPGSYKCTCADGYTGPHCTMKLASCHNVTCSGHGHCIEHLRGYICNCTPGYTGTDCEVDINECDLNVCEKQAINCTNLSGSFKCTCNTGWQGHNCTQDINECLSTTGNPCSGNGMCTNTPGHYVCSCFPGFSGTDCSVFLNVCEDLICRNNGTCVVKNSETKCACVTGWTGISCADDINECEINIPCKNSGICQNTDGSYYCRCMGGWTGRTCDTDIDECLDPLCRNKGVCSNIPGSYKCACQTGWIGMLCEIQNMKSLTGMLLRFVFQHNILKQFMPATITHTSTFLSGYVCNSSNINFFLSSIQNNYIQFRAQCHGVPMSKVQIMSALQSIPNHTLSHLFPSPLTQVQEKLVKSSTSYTMWQSSTSLDSSSLPQTSLSPQSSSNSVQSSPPNGALSVSSSSTLNAGPSTALNVISNNESWLTDHWPLAAGCGGAVVLIAIVLAVGLFRFRRIIQNRKKQSFANPGYTAEMQHYADDD